MDSDRDGIPDYRDVDNLGNADVNVTNINTAVTGNLKTNDEVPVGSTYKQPAANANNPNGATLVVNSDGTYTFTGTTPGKYIYYVPVCGPNQTNGCPLTPLEITVLDPLNTDKPVANNDFATIAQGTPISLNVLANDKAGDEGKVINPSSLTVSNAPKHGTAVVNNDGTITYTPSPYFVGTDSIVYQVCDNNNPAQCQTAVAYFKIEATGVTPVTTAADDYISIVSSATGSNIISGTVLLNDQNAGGGNLSATLISGPSTAQGTLVFNSDGSYSFTPAAGFVGPINIVYEVCGGSPVDCAKATLHILVNPPPTLVNDTASAYINIPIGGNISTNDIVPAGTTYGQPAQITGATITVGANGTYTFTATATGTYTYTIPVCAPGQTTNCPTETLVITVPVNNLVDDAATAYVNIPKSGNISTNDVVPPGTTYGQPAQLTGATITVGPNGTYTFTATTAGTYTYTVPVCAPSQTTNCPTETLVVTVPVNTLLNDTANAVVNIPTTGNISTNDVVPAGTTYGLPVANPSNPTGATISVGANGTYTFTATLAGTYTYTVPVCAPGQSSNCPTETLVIVVTDPTPPTIPVVSILTPDFGATDIAVPLSGNLNTNDNIPTGTTYGQPAANAGNPTGATITVNANGTYSFNATQPGTYTYYVPVCAAGQTTGCPFSPLVITVVDPLSKINPPFVNPDIATTLANTPVITNVLANDKAANLGTNLNPASVSVVTAPKNGTVVVNPDGTLTYTPAAGFVGTDSVTYNVCDNSTPTPICKSGMVYYTVKAATASPTTVAGDDFANTIAGNPTSGNVLANDKNTGGAILTVTGNATVPSNKGTIVINPNGTYTFTPATGFSGPIDVTYTVCGGTPQVCTNATLHLLVEPLIPAKILEVTKIANSAKMNLDGSFNISFVLKIQNLTKDYIDSVLLKDDLSKVFTNTTGVKVSSVVVSGKLVKNNSYDGVQNIDLLSIQSALDPQKEDSVILNINVASSVSGNFLNTAIATAPTAYGLVSTISTDPTKLSSSTDTTRRPTQFMIPLIEVMIPPSFSPNSDGFNDAWVISRPAGTTITVKVFNRWGNEVYSSADYKNDWRGKGVNNILGEDLPEGTYYYVVETRDSNGTTRKFAGSLTLVR
jgi:gliding motility-associated-like protein